ncbi:MAG: AAA family ATPase [Aggregatilineales bacterium]
MKLSSFGSKKGCFLMKSFLSDRLLDTQSPDMPGVIAIEEPDTAVHPLLLRRFVELLQSHVKRADRPRQYILTTHNPMLLNFFEPNEVRIVERDEQGVTTVQPIDLNVAKAWLEEEGAYNLGDIWTTRLLGGVPE